MAHVAISSVPSYPCNCSPAPDCITVLNSGDTAPDLVLGILTMGDLNIRYADIIDVDLKCDAAAVAQVNTLAPSSFTVGDCCGTTDEYILQITNSSCFGTEQPRVYTVDVDADATAADIVDSFVAQINADTGAFVTAADTGSTFTITADTAGCAFTVDFVSDNLVNIATTPNVAEWGTHAQLIEWGANEDDLADGVTYHTIDFTYRSFEPNPVQGCEKCYKVCETVCRVAVSDNAGGDTIITAISDVTDGTDSAAAYLGISDTLVCA